MQKPSSDIAFTDAVKRIQQEKGSRANYEKLEARGGFRTDLTDDFVDFLAGVDTAYLATASAAGQPYAQHRGGPGGFIRALDQNTIGFADFAGNRQYVSIGNLAENDRVFLFLMDYAAQRRIKVWGRGRVVEEDPELIARLMPAGYAAKAERAILISVEAWDVNCRQHIPRKIDAADAASALSRLQARLDALEAENETLRAAMRRAGVEG